MQGQETAVRRSSNQELQGQEMLVMCKIKQAVDHAETKRDVTVYHVHRKANQYKTRKDPEMLLVLEWEANCILHIF